jgi:hypothetical protein
MRQDGSLPSYGELFGDLDLGEENQARSVYSPAAYLADLLQLLDDSFDDLPLTGDDRRADLRAVPLDAENTGTEVPYLDIVNRVLARLIGKDANEELKDLRFPFTMPFSLAHEQVKRYLHHARVLPVELYAQFAAQVDADVVAREYLGLTAGDVEVLTTIVEGDELKACYGLDEWGRARNNLYHDGAVDAGFVGVDGRTYVFSGNQFVVYAAGTGVDADTDGPPRPVADHWGGLTGVTLAYVRDGQTYLFEKPDGTGVARYVVYEGENMLVLYGDQVLYRHEPTRTWAPPRPVERIWPGIDRERTGPLTAAFRGADGATYLFFADQFTRWDGQTCAPRRAVRDAWGRSRNNFVAGGGRVDAAFVDRDRTTFLFSGDQYVRYSGADYRYADAGTRRRSLASCGPTQRPSSAYGCPARYGVWQVAIVEVAPPTSCNTSSHHRGNRHPGLGCESLFSRGGLGAQALSSHASPARRGRPAASPQEPTNPVHDIKLGAKKPRSQETSEPRNLGARPERLGHHHLHCEHHAVTPPEEPDEGTRARRGATARRSHYPQPP